MNLQLRKVYSCLFRLRETWSQDSSGIQGLFVHWYCMLSCFLTISSWYFWSAKMSLKCIEFRWYFKSLQLYFPFSAISLHQSTFKLNSQQYDWEVFGHLHLCTLPVVCLLDINWASTHFWPIASCKLQVASCRVSKLSHHLKELRSEKMLFLPLLLLPLAQPLPQPSDQVKSVRFIFWRTTV